MKFVLYRFFACIVVCVIGTSANAGETCSQPQTNKAVSRCLQHDLQVEDAKLNEVYRKLMSSVKAEYREGVRDEQRSWVASRNAKCDIDNKESDRSAWLKTVTTSHRKMLCVTREAQTRIQRLEELLAKQGAPKVSRPIGGTPDSAISDFLRISPTSRSTGRWYFEVTLDTTRIAASQSHIGNAWPTTFWMGCASPNADYDVGLLFQVRGGEIGGVETVGFALDLDQGRIYSHRNGRWQDGEPENSNGQRVKLGLSYVCGLESTIAIGPLLAEKSVVLNFGETPFKSFGLSGFKPFHQGFLWIQGAEEEDRRIYFDYRQLQVDPTDATAFIKEEFYSARDSGDGIPNHTSRIAQVYIDCSTEQMKERSLMLIAKDGTVLAQIHKPREVGHRPGLDTIGGRFARTVCFLQKTRISLPSSDIGDRWDEMQSPAAGIRIFEAVDRRQYKNGLLFVKQMNDVDSPSIIFGKQTRKLVAVSAIDCKDIAANQLIGIRFDNQGSAVGIDFFMDKRPLRLERNKRRFADACASLGGAATN